MNRIDKEFEMLKANNKKALIPFVTCGDLDIESTANLIINMAKNNANIIEIGVPFSDPLADGVVIQESYFRALKNGTKIKDVFNCVSLVREKSQVPLVIMVYYNMVFSYGVSKFIKSLKDIGVDGIIVPDIPLEERCELKDICEKEGIYLIPLVAPTSKERIERITKDAKGFVYCVSSNGTTGERTSFNSNIKEYLKLVKEKSDCPICLGFGISSKETVNQVIDNCDGVIVGSAIVKRMRLGEEAVIEFIKSLM